MSSSLIPQQYPACLVCIIWIIFEMRCWWTNSSCFEGCCFQDWFNIARSVLTIRLVSVYVVLPYSRTDTIAARKKLRFILQDKFDFHVINNLSIAVYAFTSRILMSFSANETLLLKSVNLSTSLREPLSSVTGFWPDINQIMYEKTWSTLK